MALAASVLQHRMVEWHSRGFVTETGGLCKENNSNAMETKQHTGGKTNEVEAPEERRNRTRAQRRLSC
eukprot:IDg9275t1